MTQKGWWAAARAMASSASTTAHKGVQQVCTKTDLSSAVRHVHGDGMSSSSSRRQSHKHGSSALGEVIQCFLTCHAQLSLPPIRMHLALCTTTKS